MGVRNFLVLFFAAMAISLVILVVFFSLFFKNIDLSFNTKMPESAPSPLEEKAQPEIKPLPKKDERFKADGIQRSTVNVPSDTLHHNSAASSGANADTAPAIGVGVQPGASSVGQAKTTPALPDANPIEDVVPNNDDNGVLSPSREVSAPTPGRGFVPPAPHAPRVPQRVRPTRVPASDDTPQRSAPVPAAAPENTPEPQIAPPVPEGVPSGALPSERHQVYLDHFATPEQAQHAAERLQEQGITAIVRFNSQHQPLVQMGTFSNRSNAQQLANRTGAKLKTLP